MRCNSCETAVEFIGQFLRFHSSDSFFWCFVRPDIEDEARSENDPVPPGGGGGGRGGVKDCISDILPR